MPSKKPPQRVVNIKGNRLRADVITQEELQEIADLQAAEWMASQAAHKAVMRLRARLEDGAKTAEGALRFDVDLGMVRSKRQEGAG